MIELKKLLSAIASSVQSSQELLKYNKHKMFLEHFTVDNNGINDNEGIASAGADTVLTPKVHNFNLTKNQNQEPLVVPRVALSNHNSIALDNVKVVLNVSGKVEENRVMVNIEPINTDETLQHHQITMEFKQQEASEGEARIITATSQFI